MPPSRPRARTQPENERELASASSRLLDAELVSRCAAGDEDAWKSLVHRYQRLVYTIPYRMGLDPAEADDVFQITFIRLSQRLSTLKDPSRVRAWLVTTARRVALKALGRVRAEEDSEKILRELTDPAELPVEEIHRLEEQQIVRIALERLPERCRKLLSLLYYPSPGERGPSYDVAARELDLPLGSIGPTRMRCLKKLLVEYRRLVRE